MKKFIPQPNLPKTEEVKQIDQQENKWEKWGFVKKGDKNSETILQKSDEISEAVLQKGESSRGKRSREEEIETSQEEKSRGSTKKEKLSQIVVNKSDIIVSLNEEYAQPIEKREKTYEFRKWKADPEVKRMWIYVNRPVAKLIYIAEIDSPVEYPTKLSEKGLHNDEFNQGADWAKDFRFAYRIKHLYKLNNPIDSKEMKEKYGMTPPQKLTYASKYPQLIKDIIISEQEKIF